MKMTEHLKSVLIILATVAGMLVAASIFDIILAALYLRAYSNAVFVVIFGVAGIFAGIIAYGNAIKMYKEDAAKARWLVAAMVIAAGLAFWFLIAPIEGGEYEVPFKAYGITIATAAIFVAWQKIDF